MVDTFLSSGAKITASFCMVHWVYIKIPIRQNLYGLEKGE